MRVPVPHLTALIVGAASALALGCGARSNLIPDSPGAALKTQLASIRSAVDAGNCADATTGFAQAVAINKSLPLSVDLRLRAKLVQGLASLGAHLETDCAAAKLPSVTDTTPTVTDTTPTETTATATTPTETVTTTTTPPVTDTAPTTPTPTTSTPTTGTVAPAPTDTGATGGTPGDGTATP